MAYKEDPQIEESNSCTVTLRSGHKLIGDMRKWERFYQSPPPAGMIKNPDGPVLAWCLVAATAKGVRRFTWMRNGQYRMAGQSRYDITDFHIGRPPT